MSFKTPSTKKVLNDYPELSESVSDVDSEDIAKILKGADDIDDELFGFPKKGSNESKVLKQTSSFDKDKEKGKKVTKSIGFGDFDDSDPLGDLSLSDGDDIYGGVSKVDKDSKIDNIGKTEASSKRQITSSLSPMESKEKSTKSKLIKDLFGLDNDGTNEVIFKDKPVIAAERKKDDWLGIKDSPKKLTIPSDSTNLASESDPVAGEVQKEHEDKAKNNSSFVSIQDSIRPATKNNDQSTILKEVNFEKDQKTAKSSFIGFDSSENNDLFDSLDDSKVNSDDKLLRKTTSANVGGKKKSDLTDELFGTKINTSRNVESANVTSSMTKASINGTKLQLKDNIMKEPPWMSGENSAIGTGQYKPSSGSARRPGFGRRRDSIPLAYESTPVRVAEDDAVRPLTGQLEQASSDIRIAPSSQTHMNFIENVKPAQSSNALPPWLGGAGKNKEDSDVKQVDLPTRGKQERHAADNDLADEGVHLIGDVMSAATALGQQSTVVMEEAENHLVAVVHMKRQQDMIAELCNRQKQLLDVQRHQIEQLVKQQIKRQLKVDQQMRQQQDRINALIQSLITDVKTSASNDLTAMTNDGLVKEELHIENDFSMNEGIQELSSAVNKQRDVVCELETELQKLRIENTSLQQHLKVFEDRHEEEIKRLEHFYKNEIIHWEAREERLRQTQEELQKDYEARISRLQENELRLIEQHNMRVDNLQKERLVDLTQVGEFHRMAMEQVASVGKLLFENTRVIESKRAIENHQPFQPLDETQLSTRELALVRKEKEIESLRVSLEKEQMKFVDEREELVERLDKDRREYEENLRQLKREQNALKLRGEEFVREQERENSLLQMQRKQIEELRTKVLSEQTKAIEDRLHVTASQARLDALARLQGGQDATSISSFDLVQVRAEVEGTLNAAKEERKKAEEERHKLKQERLSLEAEKWRLQEWEQEITAKSKHVEEMVKVSELKREEGVKAMAEAKLLEKKVEAQNRDFQSQSNDLYIREEALVKEKLELARDKAILERRRAQLDSVLPPLSPSENFTLGITNSNRLIIDPKKLIMKLKAEKELETSAIRT